MLPLFDDNPTKRTPVVVLAFVVINLVLLGFELSMPSERALEAFVRTWGLVPADLWHPRHPYVWLTPVTSMFLHGGWAHLLGNCWFLWIFGNNIEDRLGPVRFVVFYLLSGLGAAAAQVAVGPMSTMPMVGASGAISGVLAAYLRFYPGAPVYTFVPIFFAPILPIPAFVFILLWFGLQFWQGVGVIFGTGVEGGVAWWAHIGGFAVGFLIAPLFAPSGRRRASRRRG